MTDLYAYRVEPEYVPPPEPVRRDDSPVVLRNEENPFVLEFGGYSVMLAFGFFLGAAILLWIVGMLRHLNLTRLFSDYLSRIFLWSVVAAPPAALLLRYLVSQKRKRQVLRWRAESHAQAVRERGEQHKSEVGRKEKEAQALTQQLRELLKESLDTQAKLAASLASAVRAVEEAEREYAESAFDPYWTAVEEAAEGLAAYDQGVRRLSRGAREYYERLEGRRHNFPAFPFRAETLPDPAPVVAEFRRVVRLGQANFEFASIWEHRLTRHITGFRNLGDAVKNLGGALERSFSSLESSNVSGLPPASKEQAGPPKDSQD